MLANARGAPQEHSGCPAQLYLALLADDGHGVLQLHVVEKALQKHVGHADQVVVLLCFVERIASLANQLPYLF